MNKILLVLSLLITCNSFSQIKNYLFIGMDRELLKDTNYFKPELFYGVQIAYSWRQLESARDTYDFSIINEDLAILKKYGKKLFISFEDVSFSMKYNHTPKYLLEDSLYNGGANKQYKFPDYHELVQEDLGWVTRRWDPAVQKRLHKLFKILGEKYDGIIDGITTEETAVTFGKGPLHPPGFGYIGYRNAFIENMIALKAAFKKSTVMVYGNFMPGGYMPFGDSTLLKTIYETAWSNNIAVGGPDLFPYKPEQMQNSYHFIRQSNKKVATGLAVQDGNYNFINPVTQRLVTAADIYKFSKDYLHLDYIFWGTEQPYFRQQTIPFLKALKTK